MRASSFRILLLAVVGCDASTLGHLDASRSAIIGGTEDTTTEAVVLVRLSSGFCSGTLILAEATRGYALTAAHCFNAGMPTSVERWGATAPTASYTVTGFAKDARYAPIVGAYDFAVVALENILDQPPVMPVVSPSTGDGLQAGNGLTLLGFGRTIATGSDPSPLRRRRITLPIDALDAFTLRFQITTQGPCFGDSGGPGVVELAGVPTLVSVASTFYSGTCTGTLAEARVTSGLAWIDTTIKDLGGSGLPGYSPMGDTATVDGGVDATPGDATPGDGSPGSGISDANGGCGCGTSGGLGWLPGVGVLALWGRRKRRAQASTQ